MTVEIASNAVVEEGATIGDGTVIWDATQVRTGADVGADCVVGRNVFIDAGVIVGDRCKLQNNALLYAPAQLDDGVFIGPAVVLTNDRYPRAVEPDGAIKRASDWHAEGVQIGKGASVGAGAVVLAGVVIGPWSMVAAASMVTRDVPAFALVAGSPARRIAWIGRTGHPLESAGDDRWRCPKTGSMFVETEPDQLEESA